MAEPFDPYAEIEKYQAENARLRAELARVNEERADLMACFIDLELTGDAHATTGRWRTVVSPEMALCETPTLTWETRADAEAAALSSVRSYVGPAYRRERIWAATLARRQGPLPAPSGDVR